MGGIGSKDKRRISFSNDFTISPALSGQKSIEDDIDDNVLNLNTIAAVAEKNDDLDFPECSLIPTSLVEKENSEVDYWSNRIEYLKKEHRIINKIIEDEYEKTLQSTTKLLDSPDMSPGKLEKIKPCFDWQSKIIQCYADNPNQPLLCSPMVKAFSECVTSFHIGE